MDVNCVEFYKEKLNTLTADVRLCMADTSIPVEQRIDLFMEVSRILPVMSPRKLKEITKYDREFLVDIVLFLANRTHSNVVTFVDHDHHFADNTKAWELILKYGYAGYTRL